MFIALHRLHSAILGCCGTKGWKSDRAGHLKPCAQRPLSRAPQTLTLLEVRPQDLLFLAQQRRDYRNGRQCTPCIINHRHGCGAAACSRAIPHPCSALHFPLPPHLCVHCGISSCESSYIAGMPTAELYDGKKTRRLYLIKRVVEIDSTRVRVFWKI